MQVLITGAETQQGQIALPGLRARHNIVILETETLLNPAKLEAELAGIEAVLHLAPLLAVEAEQPAFDLATRGTYNLMNAAIGAGVRRVVVGSTLDLFERVPAAWKVTEGWRPRPRPVPEHLAPLLAEQSVRESARSVNLPTICLRFGQASEEETAEHIYDAVEAVGEHRPFWRVRHVGERMGTRQDDGRRWQEILGPEHSIRSRPICKVVMFGAGGPVAADAAQNLKSAYTLRLTDLRPLEEIAREAKRQSEYAPLPVPLDAPHENRVVDVRNYAEVEAACEGMDAIINCTVVRHDAGDAFRVNTWGAYNIARAAVHHNIRRIVHTGPQMVALTPEVGYWGDEEVPGNVPPRVGTHLYGHSKLLGQEILRAFAEFYSLEVPVLLFNIFVAPDKPFGMDQFAVSWRDSSRALKAALDVASLPRPYELMNISADLPHGRFLPSRAEELLGWKPLDNLHQNWRGAGEIRI